MGEGDQVREYQTGVRRLRASDRRLDGVVHDPSMPSSRALPGQLL